MNRTMLIAAVLSPLFLFSGAEAWALHPETVAAIHTASLSGRIVARGDMDRSTTSSLMKSLRAGGSSNSEIAVILRAILGGEPRGTGPGLGPFVQDAHARGLRGRALADAIHAEQARRGVPGHSGRDNGTRVEIRDNRSGTSVDIRVDVDERDRRTGPPADHSRGRSGR